MKKIMALVAAVLITTFIGAGMLALGGSALLYRPATAQAAGASDGASLQQLQSLVNQYQQREQQYQAELDNARQQLQQASGEIEQYQNLLAALQQRGVIRIDQEGRIFVPGGDH